MHSTAIMAGSLRQLTKMTARAASKEMQMMRKIQDERNIGIAFHLWKMSMSSVAIIVGSLRRLARIAARAISKES